MHQDTRKLILIESCPLCGCAEADFHSEALPNLYSEKIAALLSMPEAQLLTELPNMQCRECRLIYKQKWFQSADLKALFSEHVPSHPKGWDALAERFSPANFYVELALYERALAERDQENINRYRRALSAIIDSVPGVGDQPDYHYLLEAISTGELAVLKSEEIRSLLAKNMSKPVAFKRFSGFSDADLWHYLENKLGPIENYAELGCPLWGLLRLAAQKDCEASFYRRPENNYWGQGCQREGLHCTAYLAQHSKVQFKDWEQEKSGPRKQLIGFFQYLDHLNEPMAFLERVFAHWEHAAIILDRVDQGVYIQHFTGFTEETMRFLAARFAKELHSDYRAILPSGNILYLLKSKPHA